MFVLQIFLIVGLAFKIALHIVALSLDKKRLR